jgi:hypothetical protein
VLDRAARYWVAPFTLLAVLYVWHVTHTWFSTSDTGGVLLGTAAAHNCLKAGTFFNCAGAGYDVSHYPLLQYIPTFAMKLAGFSLQDAYQALCWISAAAFAGTLAVLWYVGRKTKVAAIAPLLLACGLTAPLLWYSHSGFREALSAFVRVLFAAGLVLEWPAAVVAVALCVSVISNEAAFPFLVALGALALYGRRRSGGSVSRRDVTTISAGALAGLALTLAFNLFRYGTPENTWYLQAHVKVPGLGVRESSFAALVAAPNVGLIWYWPLAFVVLVTLLAVAWRRRHSDRATAGLAAAIVGVLVAVFVFLVVFYSPFGWEAWGPRYVVAWIPPLLVVGGFLFADPLAAALGRVLASSRRFAIAAVALVALALPQFGAFLDWRAGFRLFDPDRACPIHLPDPRNYAQVFGDMRPYYSCKLHQAWGHKPALLDGLAVLGHPWPALQAALYAVTILMLLFVLRTRAIYARAP